MIDIDSLWLISKHMKRYEPNNLDNKEQFKIKCFEQNISKEFVAYCYDHLDEDYDDILDEWIMIYEHRLNKVKRNKELIKIYKSYIKVLNNLKIYIEKELY